MWQRRGSGAVGRAGDLGEIVAVVSAHRGVCRRVPGTGIVVGVGLCLCADDFPLLPVPTRGRCRGGVTHIARIVCNDARTVPSLRITEYSGTSS